MLISASIALISVLSCPSTALSFSGLQLLTPGSSVAEFGSFSVLEFSSWNILVWFFASSITGLWIFASYMEFDKHFTDFSLKLTLFLFSVWLVVSAGDLFLWLFAWECVGFISFRLIGFWAERNSTVGGAFSAIGFNRIGDLFLILAISSLSGSIATAGINSSVSTLLIAASSLKSVTFIFNLWLPEAMEGPTPVSSLLHSCTLVMAGIFAVTRLHLAVSLPVVVTFAAGFALTSLISRSEKDFKRIIAGSTAIMVAFLWVLALSGFSQLSTIICLIHAGYKSCIFVLAGRLIATQSSFSELALSVPRSLATGILVPILVASGLKMGNYSSAKHSAHSITADSVLFSWEILVGLYFFAFWILSLRILSASKSRGLHRGFPETAAALIVLVLVILNLILGFSGGESDSSGTWIAISLAIFHVFSVSVTLQFSLPSISSNTETHFGVRHGVVAAGFRLLAALPGSGSISAGALLVSAIGVLIFG